MTHLKDYVHQRLQKKKSELVHVNYDSQVLNVLNITRLYQSSTEQYLLSHAPLGLRPRSLKR